MSRASQAGNGVMKAVEDICGLFNVPVMRMQSRTFTVVGEGGRERPMFVGEWTDAMGVKHRKGLPDLLLQPKIKLERVVDLGDWYCRMVIPLWVECKAGSGKPSDDQLAFEEYAGQIGVGYVRVTDSCEQLMEWFKKYGVEK